ncbi:MAG: hypothetical protein K6G80_01855, partial [Treponema sp.]|nr:hypothetical protein [Treponema sp.]
MKHRTVSTGVGSTLFILMIVTALACVRPVYLRLSAALTVLEQQVLSVVEQRTGLVVSYEKLAPSVLSALNLKGVSLSDAVTGKKIADIRRITVSYRFPDFFSKKPLYAIKSVSVTGVTLEYDAVKDGALLEKWRLLMPEEKKEVRPEKRTIDFANLSLNLPFLVQLKNISLHYSDAKNDALLTVKRIALTSQFDGNGVEVKTEGRFTCRSDALMEGKRRAVLASSFSVDGVFYPDLNGSAANLRLVAENTADYTVTNADLLVNYADSKLQVRSMRSVLPYSLYLEADSQTGTVFTSLSFENFEPLSLVRIKRMPQRLRKFSGTTVNGSAQASFSKKTGVSFSVDGSVTLPAAVMAAAGGAGTGVSGAGTNSPGTGNGAGSSVANASGAVSGTARSASASSAVSGAAVTVSTKIHGDSDSIQIEKLSASGKTVQADFTGSYDVRQKQPSGVFSLEYFVLGNGNVISTEVYLEPLSAGFMCFSPQLFLGDRSLTALQLTAIPAVDSWDFVFECDDYSHADFEQSGHVRMEGSWLKGTGAGGAYVQSQVSVNNLFVDSMLYDAAFFLSASSGKSLSAAAKNLSPYIMSSDLYLSSDFHSFSFNAPFFILANTQNDHELLMFAADGSNQTVQLSNFELQFGSMSASANIQADFDRGFDDFTFFGSATVNALPYSFNGNYARRWLSVSGDYGFEAVLSLADEVTGSIRFSQLPVAAGKNVFAFSTESSFSWSEETGPTAELYSFSMEDASGASSLNPRM